MYLGQQITRLWLAAQYTTNTLACDSCVLAENAPKQEGGFDIAQSDSLLGFFRKMFHVDFMPHGHCYWWKPEIVWLHVFSDAAIALAYFSIPAMLFYFVKRKKDVPFNWIFIMFAAFIFWCGTTHALNIVTLWVPVYRLDGIVKAITAVVSIATALCLFPLIPQALALKSPKELEEANRQLDQENKRREVVEHQLTRSLKEREALLREVHHRVKNNFQITSSLLSLQARTTGDPKAREVFLENENRIRSMAIVHEKLYGTDSLSAINIKDYVHQLVPGIVDSYGRSPKSIKISIDCEPLDIAIGQAIPLGLIVNELVSNAVKHGIPENSVGELEVSVKCDANNVVLCVRDSGRANLPKLDYSSSPTLGLQLVDALTKQLNGVLEVRTGDKTEFIVRFKRESG